MPSCLMTRSAFGAPLLAVAILVTTDVAAGASTACVGAPNATAPQGSHWYYRLDRATKKKCWFLAATRPGTVRAATRVPLASRMPAQKISKRAPSRDAGDSVQASMDVRPQRFTPAVAALAGADVRLPAELSQEAVADTAGADAVDNGLPAMNLAMAAPPAADDQEFTVARAAPMRVAMAVAGAGPARAADAPTTPAHAMFLVIAAVAIAGSLLYATVRLLLARSRRVYVTKARTYPLAEPMYAMGGRYG